MKIYSISVYQYRIPLEKTLIIMGKKIKSRCGLIIELTDGKGNKGFGEVAPLPGVHKETLPQAEKNLLEVIEYLPGYQIIDKNDLLDYYVDWKIYHSVRFGVETAMIDLFTKNKGLCFADFFSRQPDNEVLLNALVMANEDIGESVVNLILEGYKTIKIKIGRNIKKEYESINKLTTQLEENGIKLRLDANRSLSFKTAVNLLKKLPAKYIEYCEEPLMEPERLEELYRKTALPIALDESIYMNDSDDDLIIPEGGGALIIKPSAVGSYKEILYLFDLAERYNLKFVLSSTFESGVGLSAILSLAAGMNLYPTAIGLDTYKWFKKDIWFKNFDMFKPCINLEKLKLNTTKLDKEICKKIKIFKDQNV